MHHLTRAALLVDADAAQVQRWAAQTARRNRFGPIPGMPCRASLSFVQLHAAAVGYGEVSGGLVNVASAGGTEVVVGAVEHGAARVHVNGAVQDLGRSGAVVFLPGDVAVQVLRDCRLFSLRIPVSADTLATAKSRPFLELACVSRWIDAAAGNDITRLLRFFAIEFDRQPPGANRPGDQAQVLGHALVERAARVVQGLIGAPPSHDRSMRDICRACDQAILAVPGRRFTAADLAETACCSARQLYRAFADVMQTTPLDYQRRARLLGARAALVQGAPEAADLHTLAQAYAFGSDRGFARAYRAEYGEDPRDTVRNLEALMRGLPQATAPRFRP